MVAVVLFEADGDDLGVLGFVEEALDKVMVAIELKADLSGRIKLLNTEN